MLLFYITNVIWIFIKSIVIYYIFFKNYNKNKYILYNFMGYISLFQHSKSLFLKILLFFGYIFILYKNCWSWCWYIYSKEGTLNVSGNRIITENVREIDGIIDNVHLPKGEIMIWYTFSWQLIHKDFIIKLSGIRRYVFMAQNQRKYDTEYKM